MRDPSIIAGLGQIRPAFPGTRPGGSWDISGPVRFRWAGVVSAGAVVLAGLTADQGMARRTNSRPTVSGREVDSIEVK